MGRGRGKGKKLNVVVSHDDQGSSGEEVIPTYKRRGRPQKSLKDERVENDTAKIDGEGGEDVKLMTPTKELNGLKVESGKKRKRFSQIKENSDSVVVENNVVSTSSNEEMTKTNGFRHNGSRRKSKPHRAAEAGVECK